MRPSVWGAGSNDPRRESCVNRAQLVAHHQARFDTDLSRRDCGAHHVNAEPHYGGGARARCDHPRFSGHHPSCCPTGSPAHRLRLRCGGPADAVDHRRDVYFGPRRGACRIGHYADSETLLAGPADLCAGLLRDRCGHRCHGHLSTGLACQTGGAGEKTRRCRASLVHDDYRLCGDCRYRRPVSRPLFPGATDGGHRRSIVTGHCCDADCDPRS